MSLLQLYILLHLIHLCREHCFFMKKRTDYKRTEKIYMEREMDVYTLHSKETSIITKKFLKKKKEKKCTWTRGHFPNKIIWHDLFWHWKIIDLQNIFLEFCFNEDQITLIAKKGRIGILTKKLSTLGCSIQNTEGESLALIAYLEIL
jgi:hypothetical protein